MNALTSIFQCFSAKINQFLVISPIKVKGMPNKQNASKWLLSKYSSFT